VQLLWGPLVEQQQRPAGQELAGALRLTWLAQGQHLRWQRCWLLLPALQVLPLLLLAYCQQGECYRHPLLLLR
jgi:hypothetical protein